MTRPPLLEIDRATFSYLGGGPPVVDDVSLAVHAGRLVGLLGPNGSGKSTLVRLAAGLLRPSRGTVSLTGKPLANLSRRDIARRIALVPQQPILPDAFTGWEVALAGRTPHLGMLQGISARDEAIVRQALALVDATHLADRRVEEMSGGERQRLLLARALAQEPVVLLLDEPTLHLDLPHQLTMLDLALRFARHDDLAILAVFHDLNLAAAYCDEIALLREGRMLVHGPSERVLVPAWIATAYDIDVSVMAHPQSGRPVVLLPTASGASLATASSVGATQASPAASAATTRLQESMTSTESPLAAERL